MITNNVIDYEIFLHFSLTLGLVVSWHKLQWLITKCSLFRNWSQNMPAFLHNNNINVCGGLHVLFFNHKLFYDKSWTIFFVWSIITVSVIDNGSFWHTLPVGRNNFSHSLQSSRMALFARWVVVAAECCNNNGQPLLTLQRCGIAGETCTGNASPRCGEGHWVRGPTHCRLL